MASCKSWKILLSNSYLEKSIAGKCDWQNRIIWINDNYIHTSRKDKIHMGRIKDVFSLSDEQRFTLILNHEVFHAVYHEKINNLVAVIALALIPIFLVDIFLLQWIIMSLIIILIFAVVAISLYILEEIVAYKLGENYEVIDKRMFARLSDKIGIVTKSRKKEKRDHDKISITK